MKELKEREDEAEMLRVEEERLIENEKQLAEAVSHLFRVYCKFAAKFVV